MRLRELSFWGCGKGLALKGTASQLSEEVPPPAKIFPQRFKPDLFCADRFMLAMSRVGGKRPTYSALAGNGQRAD